MRYEIREIYDLYKNAYEQNARIYSDESPNLDNRAETQYHLHSIPYLQGILYQLAN